MDFAYLLACLLDFAPLTEAEGPAERCNRLCVDNDTVFAFMTEAFLLLLCKIATPNSDLTRSHGQEAALARLTLSINKTKKRVTLSNKCYPRRYIPSGMNRLTYGWDHATSVSQEKWSNRLRISYVSWRDRYASVSARACCKRTIS